MSTSSPRLDALLLLDAYQTAHRQGNADLKASMWSLTKARREKPDIAAANVRHDLEPTMRIEQNSEESEEVEPALKSELFFLVDVVQKQQKEKENVPSSSARANNTTDKDNKESGLRNRHSKTDYSSSKSEEIPSMTKEDMVDDASAVIPDPLHLVGGALPPRSLLTSQQQAKRALESYILAANLIQELQLVIKKTSKS